MTPSLSGVIFPCIADILWVQLFASLWHQLPCQVPQWPLVFTSSPLLNQLPTSLPATSLEDIFKFSCLHSGFVYTRRLIVSFSIFLEGFHKEWEIRSCSLFAIFNYNVTKVCYCRFWFHDISFIILPSFREFLSTKVRMIPGSIGKLKWEKCVLSYPEEDGCRILPFWRR